MKKIILLFAMLVALSAIHLGSIDSCWAVAPKKELTLFVFLNGKNNLDSFGHLNIAQMGEIGTNERVNIIVVWGSLKNRSVRLVQINKTNVPGQGNITVLKELGSYDMGDANNLRDSILSVARDFPSNLLAVDVWDHGSGWKLKQQIARLLSSKLRMQKKSSKVTSIALQRYIRNGEARATLQAGIMLGFLTPEEVDFSLLKALESADTLEISHDDTTGHSISTEELARAMAEVSKTLEQKVAWLGFDACLMADLQVAGELKDSACILSGSQELEPGAGWPYHTWLRKVLGDTKIEPANLGKHLTTSFVDHYTNDGPYGPHVTFSTVDLQKFDNLADMLKPLFVDLTRLFANADAREAWQIVLRQVPYFYFSDYLDLKVLLEKTRDLEKFGLNPTLVPNALKALEQYVIANKATKNYGGIGGVSIWIPRNAGDYRYYRARYCQLALAKASASTQAFDALYAPKAQ